MRLAESTILLGLHSVRMVLLLFGCIVVTLFALGTCQCNLCTHLLYLHVFLKHKKKT